MANKEKAKLLHEASRNSSEAHKIAELETMIDIRDILEKIAEQLFIANQIHGTRS